MQNKELLFLQLNNEPGTYCGIIAGKSIELMGKHLLRFAFVKTILSFKLKVLIDLSPSRESQRNGFRESSLNFIVLEKVL